MKNRYLRIGLNLLHALPEIGGGWNYIQSLIAALSECDHENFYIAYVTPLSECLVPNQKNFKRVLININSTSRYQRVLYENTILQIRAVFDKIDCMHWFSGTQSVFCPTSSAVTVYDMQAFLNHVSYSQVKRIYLRLFVEMTAKRASILMPMSQATAEELSKLLNVEKHRMVVVPTVIHADFQPQSIENIKSFRIKYMLPDRFWLYVAHLYPHKNHLRLLEAYRRLKVNGETDWPLVLRGDPHGSENEVHAAIDRLELSDDVIWLTRLEGIKLPLLYASATVLVFPSLYEGAGIPVLEAMSCGCPLLASDIAPIREAAADAAYYFDPANYLSIYKAMFEFERNESLREFQRQIGLNRAARYRGSVIVSQLLNAYRTASGII